MITPPDDWTTDTIGTTSATFRNDQYELSVKIDPRYRASASRGNSRTQKPDSYRVRVVQDWFSKGVYGDRSMKVKVQSWDDAVETAVNFMEEFSDERNHQSLTDIEAAHRSVNDHETAERSLTVQASAEALADSAGYSDSLLLDALAETVNGEYRVVAHRHGDDVTYVYGAADCLGAVSVEAMYATFPVDKLALESHLLPIENLVVTITLGDYVVYRFIASNHEETTIVLPRGTRFVSSVFERTVWNVLEEKW